MSSLSRLPVPATKLLLAPTPRCPTWRGPSAPEGELLSGYSLLASAASANEIAAISGQPPNPSTEANCSTYSEFPASAPADKQGVVSGSGCVYPVETLTFADQLASAGLQWSAYMEGMSGSGGKPENCVHPASGAPEAPPPGGYAARQNPFVYFHSLLDLGACASSDLPLGELTGALAKISSTPNLLLHRPRPLQCRRRRPVPGRRTERRWRRRRLPLPVGAEDPRLTGLQAGRPFDRHLRSNKPCRLRPGERLRSAPCCSPAS